MMILENYSYIRKSYSGLLKIPHSLGSLHQEDEPELEHIFQSTEVPMET